MKTAFFNRTKNIYTVVIQTNILKLLNTISTIYRKSILTLLATIACFNLAAQQSFTKQELLDDIDSLYVMINDVHPEMFAFVAQEAFEKELEKAKLKIKEDMTLREYFEVIAPLVSGLGDGHTSIYYPYNILQGSTKVFPLKVEVMHPCFKAKILHDFRETENPIPTGSTIKSINGVEIKSLVDRMFASVSGEMKAYRVAMMNQRMTELLYVVIPDSVFTVEYIYNDKKLTKSFSGLEFSTIRKKQKEFAEQQQTIEDYSLSIDHTNKIAFIHFNYFNNINRFKKFIDSAFTVINKHNISDLIIDIRNNNGGQSNVGDEFFQYISQVPFQQFGKVQAKISERQIAYHEKYTTMTWDDFPLGIIEHVVEELYELRENHLRFSGNVYLLTSHYTFSSAASFAWTFQYFNMGTIVGQETGGLIVCFGDIIPQFLPNTRMQFGTSFKKFYLYGATEENTHGVIPDYDVSADKAMDFAIKLILKNRK